MEQPEPAHDAGATSPDEPKNSRHLVLEAIHAIWHTPYLFHIPAVTGDTQEHANKWVVLILAALGFLTTTLDSSIVNISLPAIAHTFGVGINGAIEWVIIGYLIIIASVLLSLGRMADMIGRKPIYEAGLVVFVLGSIFSGAAPSLLMLIIARLFQGLGGALIFSVNVAMITSVFPAHQRGQALGWNSVVVALWYQRWPYYWRPHHAVSNLALDILC